jgi:YidC/Oxa1 family membrane protein insertase
MDNLRLVLFFALAFVLLLIYQAWMQDYGAQSPARQETSSTAETQSTSIPPGERTAPVPEVTVQAQAPSSMPDAAAQEQSRTPQLVRVETDLLRAEISTQGGTIRNLYLLDYAVSPNTPEQKVEIFKPQTPNLYVAQSGLIGTSAAQAPTHQALFSTQRSEYRLGQGADSIEVVLTWTSAAGVKVTKRYRFTRGSYVVDLTQQVENGSDANWAARSYVQLQRSDLYDPNKSSFIHTYTGAAYYSPEQKYDKVTFKDIAAGKLQKEVTGGWIAMLQHYFVSAWIPPVSSSQTLYTNHLPGPRYVIGMYSPTVTVAPGVRHRFQDRLFVGPKLQNHLAEVATGLELTVDYGWLTILAQPIFWLLDHLHALVNNWGGAIILLTVLIKLAFYKLSETSYKSMANMRKLTPRLQALKDRYGDDKERLNQAMMEMYKKEKINPLGGCLPIVVQIPVFIALYWVLLESVEMRQAPFALWIDNLSAPDPYYVLPLIMGASMLVQQKLNPSPVDPLQAKIMMSMPIVFTVFFAFFPAGLVLYWTVNNLLSIAQQWHITRAIEKSGQGK